MGHMVPSVLIRILLRYAGAALVARGILLPSDAGDLATDSELIEIIQVGIGIACAATAEVWYYLAKKWSDAT